MFAIGYNSSITRQSSSYGKPFGNPTLLLLFPILNTKNNNDNDNEGVPFEFPYLRDFRILLKFLQYLNDAQFIVLELPIIDIPPRDMTRPQDHERS